MTDKKTVTMSNEVSVWNLDMVDPIVENEYENLRVETAEIVDDSGDVKLRLELQAVVFGDDYD